MAVAKVEEAIKVEAVEEADIMAVEVEVVDMVVDMVVEVKEVTTTTTIDGNSTPCSGSGLCLCFDYIVAKTGCAISSSGMYFFCTKDFV